LTSEECKSHATQSLLLARTAASREQRTILLELAREWERAAEQMEQVEAAVGAKKSA
jgi:hypothetical protein